MATSPTKNAKSSLRIHIRWLPFLEYRYLTMVSLQPKTFFALALRGRLWFPYLESPLIGDIPPKRLL